MEETYLQLARQIEELKQRADAIKHQEMAGVIERIRVAIEAYGLTIEQLFGQPSTPVVAKPAAKKAAAKKTAARAARPDVKFRDEAGNIWGGRGPRPAWLRNALAAGKSMSDFAAGGASVESAAPTEAPSRAKPAKVALAPKYKDDAGNTWSGRGPTPRWLKAALDSGKTLEQLAT